MISIKENVDLFPFNTFGIHATAKYLVTVASVDEARAIFKSDWFNTHPHLVLGGGSNILLTGNFEGLVSRMRSEVSKWLPRIINPSS